MNTRLPHWFRNPITSPVFEDEEKTRIAGLLNNILLILITIALVYCTLAPLLDPNLTTALLLNGVVILFYLSLLYLLRQGWVKQASLLFSSGVWVLMTVVAMVYGGVLTPGIFNYFSAIVIAGLLLG